MCKTCKANKFDDQERRKRTTMQETLNQILQQVQTQEKTLNRTIQQVEHQQEMLNAIYRKVTGNFQPFAFKSPGILEKFDFDIEKLIKIAGTISELYKNEDKVHSEE
jgi:ABC-type transporter Mla subunit MlaD